MRKIIFGIVFIVGIIANANAQRFAFVDTKQILNQMPEYKAAEKQLEEVSGKWSKEIEELNQELQRMYRALEAEKLLLTSEMLKEREKLIAEKEKTVSDLQNKRFGFEGDLFKKQVELLKPIQDKVYNAIQKLAKDRAYDFIFDKSGEFMMLYADSKYDRSKDVLKILGY